MFSTSVKMCVGGLWWNSFESIVSDVELRSKVIAASVNNTDSLCNCEVVDDNV